MADTRDRLLAAANESFRRRGYRATVVKDVAMAAGATIGSMYHFFPGGKDELTVATVVASGEAYRQLFEVIADSAPDVAAAITDFFDGAADVLRETDYIDPCPIGTIARETASMNDEIRAATDAVFLAWIETLRTRLVTAGLAPDESADLATTVVATLEGAFVLARARRDTAPLLRAGRTIRRLIDHDIARAHTHTKARATTP